MSELAVVGKRYSIVVPKSVRKKMNLKEGQRVMLKVEEGRLLIEPLPTDPYGVLERVIGEPYDEAKDEEKAEKWVKKHTDR
ncbi:MAG: AbrB/MazE/SpoVT family DNA-binding domain-containing protein [Thaumarchaeota archaeon]|nr:AbrB/MazE/SpoVT family DNA-binding domain-containing protein [Nitrososphaerota archaeon]